MQLLGQGPLHAGALFRVSGALDRKIDIHMDPAAQIVQRDPEPLGRSFDLQPRPVDQMQGLATGRKIPAGGDVLVILRIDMHGDVFDLVDVMLEMLLKILI